MGSRLITIMATEGLMLDAEENALWVEYAADRSRVDLRNALIEQHLRLVRMIAHKLRESLRGRVDVDDLISAGWIGLVRAVERFDPTREIQFATFAAMPIRGAMLDSLRESDWVPRNVRQWNKRLAAATETLTARFGRAPTDAELRRHLGVRPKAWKALKRSLQPVDVMSYDLVSVADNRESDFASGLPSKGDRPGDRQQRKDFLRRICRGLTKRQRLLLIGYYFEGESMKEIGQALELSESRISQSHDQLLKQLRGTLRRRDTDLVA